MHVSSNAMAVFPSSASQLTTPAPSRSARESCWEHRDIYFACLDKEKVIVPGTEPVESLCKKEKEIYGKECAASWVRPPLPRASSSYAESLSLGSVGSDWNGDGGAPIVVAVGERS